MNKNYKRSIALYEACTSKQKAALAFQAMSKQDATETDIIHSTVKRFAYSCLDTEYIKWRDGFHEITMLFSVMFWQMEAGKLAIHGLLLHEDSKPADSQEETQEQLKKVNDFVSQLITIKGKQLAAIEAMRTVCNQHGFDFESVERLADIYALDTALTKEPDINHQMYLTQVFNDCLPSH